MLCREKERHSLGVRRPTCSAPWESQFPSLGLGLLTVQWDHVKAELASLCSVPGLWRVFHSPETGSAGRAQEGGGRPGRGVPSSSNPPTLSSGQPVPRLARCSRVSVSSSHAHRATASSPRRMDPRTSLCTYLSESLRHPFSWLGPCCRVLAVPQEMPPLASPLPG